MSRWSDLDQESIALMREALREELSSCPPFPEVVGDRRIIRFLKARGYVIEESAKMMRNFLKWRKDNNVDQIRQNIVYGGMNNPLRFPKGEAIIRLAPQIVLSHLAKDKNGCPLVYEQYNFNPKEFFREVSIQEYLVFLTYSLEFRSLLLEQMSEELEREYLKSHAPSDLSYGYGVVLHHSTIRDLHGVGLSHIGKNGYSIVSSALQLGIPNYPDLLSKGHHINVPWLFNSMWGFIKGLIDPVTLTKISISSTDYLPVLLQDIDIENIPESLGGKFSSNLWNVDVEFDCREGGALYYPGAPISVSSPLSPLSHSGSTNSLSDSEVTSANDRKENNGIVISETTELLITKNSTDGNVASNDDCSLCDEDTSRNENHRDSLVSKNNDDTQVHRKQHHQHQHQHHEHHQRHHPHHAHYQHQSSHQEIARSDDTPSYVDASKNQSDSNPGASNHDISTQCCDADFSKPFSKTNQVLIESFGWVLGVFAVLILLLAGIQWNQFVILVATFTLLLLTYEVCHRC